jgi:peptide/nickel transport system permease protein
MSERCAGRTAGCAAVLVLAGLILVGIFAPLIANDRPILARVGGRLVAPALADLPLVGPLFDATGIRGIPWPDPGPEVEVILRAPVPHSYRGIHLDEVLHPPGRSHLLGTDSLGRDLLARLIHGSRPSLLVGFGATLLALLFGGLLGALAGLRGGLLDLTVIRVADTVSCFPPFILALAFVSAAGHGGLAPIIAGIAVCRWTGMARYVRGEVLRQRGEETWTAARSTGASLPRLAVRHLLPLLIPPLAVLTSFGVAHAIVLESALSFVGMGVEPPTPSWGAILAEARQTIDIAWWPVVFPAIALFLVLASLCSVAERTASGDGRTEGLPG